MRGAVVKCPDLEADGVLQREHRPDLQPRGWPDRLFQEVDLAGEAGPFDQQPGHPRRRLDDPAAEPFGSVRLSQPRRHQRQRQRGCGGEVDVAGRPAHEIVRGECIPTGEHQTEVVTGAESDVQQARVQLVHG
ncbi:hypothetical protein V2I01_19765 [Micromonospora sp. BRA006-A]|nr:hypothetical protein [Micromonospora sp. BRA006-A]